MTQPDPLREHREASRRTFQTEPASTATDVDGAVRQSHGTRRLDPGMPASDVDAWLRGRLPERPPAAGEAVETAGRAADDSPPPDIAAVQAEYQLFAAHAAVDAGLPASAGRFLYGDDPEELAESAAAFRALLDELDPQQQQQAPADLRQGARGAPMPTAPPDPGGNFIRREARR